MSNLNPTPWFLLFWATTAVAYDVWVYLVLGPDGTISATLLRWALRWPLLPLIFCFGLGVLIGHLFWPQEPQ